VAFFYNNIEQILKKHEVPGLAIASIENGQIVSCAGYGIKQSKTQDQIDKNTIFPAASLSKPVFAYGVLKLVEKGLLDLDTPLADYFPCSDIKNDQRCALITARRVLSHTAGFQNWRARGEALKIHFQPGQRFSYSGEGFVYLQKVVEKISGQPLEQYMQQNVLIPLGMTHSSYTAHKEKPANAAHSLHTTALDYAQFVQAIINNHGLLPATINQMLSPYIAVGVAGPDSVEARPGKISALVSWGLGWGLQKTQNGPAFWHWGDHIGFKNYVVGFKDTGKAVVIFTNSENGMKAIKEIMYQLLGMREPAFHWLNY
jgi:CubicO group peptidase (beta-lactamase class C family)